MRECRRVLRCLQRFYFGMLVIQGKIKRMKKKVSEIGNRIGKDVRQYGLGFLAVAVLYFVVHSLFDAFCPSVLISGFPCPGCGMTRAVIYLLRGQIGRSCAINPAGVLWAAWALLFAFERYGLGRRSKVTVRAAYVIAVFMIIVYIIRMKWYFPDRPPYVYTKENLFEKILPGYGRLVRYLTGG